jgi:hypothetical protein
MMINHSRSASTHRYDAVKEAEAFAAVGREA